MPFIFSRRQFQKEWEMLFKMSLINTEPMLKIRSNLLWWLLPIYLRVRGFSVFSKLEVNLLRRSQGTWDHCGCYLGSESGMIDQQLLPCSKQEIVAVWKTYCDKNNKHTQRDKNIQRRKSQSYSSHTAAGTSSCFR